jgi:hypothetical protein
MNLLSKRSGRRSQQQCTNNQPIPGPFQETHWLPFGAFSGNSVATVRLFAPKYSLATR